MDLVQAQQDSPYKITLEIFEGPLDMLLSLIREHEIDIYDIPIVKVTEQYLAYLSLMESLDLEIAGEWLVMAATLLEIKSRMLLPKDPKVDESEPDEQLDPRLELVERLIEYEKFKSASEVFRGWEEERSKVFVRGAPLIEYDLKPKYDLENVTAADLLTVLQRILADVGEEEGTSIKRRKISVRMRIREVWRRISEAAGQMQFESLFDDVANRTEVVITFLALLELLRMQRVKVRQKEAFAPIEIVPLEDPDQAKESDGAEE